jgi:hypothetical protein
VLKGVWFSTKRPHDPAPHFRKTSAFRYVEIAVCSVSTRRADSRPDIRRKLQKAAKSRKKLRLLAEVPRKKPLPLPPGALACEAARGGGTYSEAPATIDRGLVFPGVMTPRIWLLRNFRAVACWLGAGYTV